MIWQFCHGIKAWMTKPTPGALFDRQLVWLSFILMAVGLVIVTSASAPVSVRYTGGPYHYAVRHGIFLLLGLGVAAVALQFPMSWWQRWSPYMLVGAIVLLLSVHLIGSSVNGAKRWIDLKLFNLQPAEIAKLVLFIYVASYLERRHSEVVETSWGFAKPLVVFILFGGLIITQPDLGSVVVMFITVTSMLFVAGARLWQFLALMVAGLSLIVMLIVFEPYRMRRFTAFLDPWQNPFGSGYQLTQSLMAFGRGGWFGQGLGNSIQKLEYLPEAHTDFVFAVLAEELGLFGVAAVLLLLLALVFKALTIAKKNLESNIYFGGFLAFGIGVWFAFQTLVNVGAASGLIPTKGLTLPLISYGGSSLLMMSLAVAVLLRIDFEYRCAKQQAYVAGQSHESPEDEQSTT
ncbi:putative peptidoglycan glycosyltransferase FtsW [Vibrio stylophorae]|uniref:Probable peptidoglycan glycosyltransferase FtsW n=1 Tax=Vibrio stylophorae TaxID=659351 RepID=A0ABM8ZVV6_9VIBR|nr:cell division protein FtsW [Vibrio stylophorae]CAH0534450.1 putative peptidoglycan glycosyltransferase FtsW [Vibrio stylophorae]